MPSKKLQIKAYLTEEEYRQVTRLASQTGLSISKTIKLVLLGHEVRSIVDQEAVLALLQSKADLGRLGGLLKHHLSETGGTEIWHNDLRKLLKKIESTQRDLVRDFKAVVNAYARGRK